MKEPRDPFEVLSELDPVRPEQLRDAASTPQARSTLERILSDGAHGLVRNRRRLRRKSSLLGLVPIAAAVTAGAWALTQGATKQLTIGCYESTKLSAKTIVVPSGSAPPAEICRAVWIRGGFAGPPPPLQACVLPSGAVGVFPSPAERACEQLGLGSFVSQSTTRLGAAMRLKRALVDKFLRLGCVRKQQAVVVVKGELFSLQLDAWRVDENGDFTTERPCASLAFDEEQQIVLLVPTLHP